MILDGHSETLREQAAVNSEAQFANSPTLHDEMMKAVMDGDAAHQTMSAQLLNSEALQAQLLALMLTKGGCGSRYGCLAGARRECSRPDRDPTVSLPAVAD